MQKYILVIFLFFSLTNIVLSQEYFAEHTLTDNTYVYEIKYKMDYFGCYIDYNIDEYSKNEIIDNCSAIEDITPNKTNDGILVFSSEKISEYDDLFKCSEFFHFFVPYKMEMDSRSKKSSKFKTNLYELVYQKVYPSTISFNYPIEIIKELDEPLQIVYKARDYLKKTECVRRIFINYSIVNSFSVEDSIDYNITLNNSYDYKQRYKTIQYDPNIYGSLELNLAYPAFADCNYWTIRLFENESYIWEYTRDLTCIHFVEVYDFDKNNRDEIILFHGGLNETVIKIFKRK